MKLTSIDYSAEDFSQYDEENKYIKSILRESKKTDEFIDAKEKIMNKRGGDMFVKKVWSMPNKKTFSIKPIKELIGKYNVDNSLSVDPYANNSKICRLTNDLNPIYKCNCNMEASAFLESLLNESVDFLLYDPPYSPRQIKESYQGIGIMAGYNTKSNYWSLEKDTIAKVVKKGGIVISFGWNSNGIGKTRGFETIEILLVAHGGNHNDTICVVEQKL